MQGVRWRSGAGRSSWVFILSDAAGIYWKQTLGHLVTVIVSFVLSRPYEGVSLSGFLRVLIREGGGEKQEEEKEGTAIGLSSGGLIVFEGSSGQLHLSY